MKSRIFSRLTGKRLLFSFLHALFLLVLLWWWQTMDFTLASESGLTEKSVVLKRTLFKTAEDTSAHFLFLDVSGTKKLIPREGRNGFETITNRAALAEFFRILGRVSEGKYQYVLCDIVFDKPSDDDEALGSALASTRNVLTSYSIDEDGPHTTVFPGTPSAYVGYKVSSGLFSSNVFIKYPIAPGDGLVGAPVKMYEATRDAKIEKSLGLAWVNGKPWVNHLIADYRIRPYHLLEADASNKVIPFDDMLNLFRARDTMVFRQFMQQRIIVIGDFENDIHPTVLGDMPGPLILSNIYLSLLHEDGRITAWLMLYVLSGLTLLSWLLLYPPPVIERYQRWCEKTVVGFLLGDLFLYALVTWLIVFTCYLITDFHLNLTLLSLYTFGMSIYIKYRNGKRGMAGGANATPAQPVIAKTEAV